MRLVAYTHTTLCTVILGCYHWATVKHPHVTYHRSNYNPSYLLCPISSVLSSVSYLLCPISCLLSLLPLVLHAPSHSSVPFYVILATVMASSHRWW